MRDEVRFRPPPVARTAELDWVLRHAFAERCDGGPAEGIDFAAAAALARRLGVAARLAAREREAAAPAGSPLAAELHRESQVAAASALRATAAARRVASIAAEQGFVCCFLKGVALEALGLTAPGTRAVADVDVLVAGGGAPALAAALVEDGFSSAAEGYPHQLPALVHPAYGSVELHVHLPGVVVAGARRFATFDGLEAAGLFEPWPGMPPTAMLPALPLLAAHLLAHALGQHGFRPDGYPLVRLVGDLLDMGAAAPAGQELMAAALPLVSPQLPAGEARAAFAVARALGAGDTTLLEADTEGGRLLRHLVAASLDDRYRESLKLQDLKHPLREGGVVRRRAAVARHALLLSRAQVDAIYGRPRHRFGYAARRLLRPFELAWRVGRALLGSAGWRLRGASADPTSRSPARLPPR